MIAAIPIAEVAALVGDPARANILCALLDGRALTASELAQAAGVTAQTASGHLAKLTQAKLIDVVKQGRHRYFRIATPTVGQMLEGIMAVALAGPPRYRPSSPLDEAIRTARTCYDHFAGRLGVAVADALIRDGHVVLADDGGEVTQSGITFLEGIGVDLADARRRKRAFCRPCLDWTERRPHIGGAVGAALASRCFALGWVSRRKEGRALIITPQGTRGFQERFGIAV